MTDVVEASSDSSGLTALAAAVVKGGAGGGVGGSSRKRGREEGEAEDVEGEEGEERETTSRRNGSGQHDNSSNNGSNSSSSSSSSSSSNNDEREPLPQDGADDPASSSSSSSSSSTKRQRYDDETDEHSRRSRHPDANEHDDDHHRRHDSSSSSSSSDSTEWRFLFENSQVGAIIGRGGETIRRLRETLGAHVHVIKNDGDQRQARERIVTIRGTDEAVYNALMSIVDILIANQTAHPDRRPPNSSNPPEHATIRFLVHRISVGAVIGKGGETIRATLHATGAHVSISSDVFANSTDKSVTVSGDRDQIAKALMRVIPQIKECPVRAGTRIIPYVPGSASSSSTAAPHGHSYANDPYSQSSSAPPQAPLPVTPAGGGPPSEQKIAIPNVCAGCVIGRKGQTIRDLRAQSGCDITVDSQDAATPDERIVTIRGTPFQIQAAVGMIRDCIEKYRPGPGQRA